MDRARSSLVLFHFTAFVCVDGVPDYIKHVLIIQSIVDTITAQDDEIMEVGLESEL
jgi:hypothetical protein